MDRRRVRCVECGFLALPWPTEDILNAIKPIECKLDVRSAIANHVYATPQLLMCLRGVQIQIAQLGDVIKQVNSQRRCTYFCKYQPGYSPDEHKNLQQEAKGQTAVLRATILGTLVGAAAGALLTWLVTHYT
jgi:hypothetical protein